MTIGHSHSEYLHVDAATANRAERSNVLPSFAASTIAYGIVCGIFLLFSAVIEGDPALFVLHIGAAGSLLLFWRQVRWGVGRYDSFGPALLLISAILRIQSALDDLFFGSRLDEIPATVPLPEDLALLLLKSESLSFFGLLVIAAVWRATVGSKVDQFSFLSNYRHVGRQLPVLMYATAIVLELAKRLAGAEFGVLLLISSMTYSFGVVSVFFIAARQKSRQLQIFWAILLAIPLTLLAMGSGMKTEMFFPVVPAALLFWFGFRNFAMRALIIILAFVLLAYSQLYVRYVREVTWADGVQKSIIEILRDFQDNVTDASLAEGMNAISSRMNLTTTRAITVAIADARGFDPMGIFGPIPGSLIPRVIWPTKPILQPGAQHTFRIRDVDAPAYEATTATATGFFSELYLGGGYLGWLLGVMIYGYLLAKLQLFTLTRLTGFGHLALSFNAAYWTLRFEEQHAAYIYNSLFFMGIFLFLLIRGLAILKINSVNRSQMER